VPVQGCSLPLFIVREVLQVTALENYVKICRYRCILAPWSRVLLEKLTVPQLVKKFPAYYGTRRFITAFTRALHLPPPEPDQ
jgi:hypothetical protein